MKRNVAQTLWQTLGSALRLVWQSSPRLAVAQGVLAVVQALLPLVTLLALKQAVDAATAALAATTISDAQTMSTILNSPPARQVLFWLLMGACALGVQTGLQALVTWIGEQHAMAISDLVHARLHAKLQEIDLAFFENSAAQDRLHLVQDQAMTQPVHTLSHLFQSLNAGVALLGVMGLLITLHPLLPIALIVSGIPILLIQIRRGRRLFAWRRDLAPMEREASYYHHLLSDGAYAGEMRLYGHGPFCRTRFEAVRLRLRQARLRWRRYLISRELALQGFVLLMLALMLLWLTGQLLSGAITLGALVMAVQAVQRGQSQLGAFTATIAEIYQSALFFRTFNEFLAEPPQIAPPAKPLTLPARLKQGIVFENVSFMYPGTKRAVLKNVSFAIQPGERVVLAGVNGSGKSTVIKLLARLYDPTEGRILADGIDLREFDPSAWRQRIGAVFQDFGRYQMSATENIWIGDPLNYNTDDPRLLTAADNAGLSSVMQNWPQREQTLLGRWLHDGLEPSVGQWQRLALARALLRDSDILVLDEPSSALDENIWREIIERLRIAAHGRMILAASHRLALANWADRILMLRQGELVESGSAAELQRRNGEFAKLFTR